MALFIDPAKAWAANPKAAKKYKIAKPSGAAISAARKELSGYQTSYTAIPKTTTPSVQKPSIVQNMQTWLRGLTAKPAQVSPETYGKATQFALEHPTSPAALSWVKGMPGGVSKQATMRAMADIETMNRIGAGGAWAEPMKAEIELAMTPLRQYMASGAPSYSEQLRLAREAQAGLEAIKQKYPQAQGFGEKYLSAVGPVREEMGFPESWGTDSKVVGKSQQGQSLLKSLQGWMGTGGEVLGKVGEAFRQPSIGTAQAQGPEGQITAPKAPEKGFTPEEWASMGRPLGGAYPGYGGVPLSGLEMAQTAVKPGVKYWWEGGTMMGAPTPEQLNTPEYAKGYFSTFLNPEVSPEYFSDGKLNARGEAALEDAWDAFTSDAKEGYYTPEQIGKDPEIHEVVAAEMLMRDKYDQQWVETLKDASLGRVITQVASQDPTKLPPDISQERLDAMVRGPDFATLYDTGYRSQAYQEEVTAGIQQIQSNGAQITYDPVSLNSLTYANIEGLKSQLAQISPAQWQTIVEGNAQITLKTEFWKFNAKGETINKGSWDIDYPPQSEMKQSEKDRYIDQQQFYNDWYWSDEATAQRQKEREESYEYYHEKDLEGWKEYYAILDGMKLYPDASEYWSQAGKFAELRRKWETSGSGMTWDVWLQQFDFEGEWYALPPQERGEKPYIYSPRMIRLNY